jgi:putative flippase GtrA
MLIGNVPMGLNKLKNSISSLVHDGLKFGVIGTLGYLIDFFIFNALRWPSDDGYPAVGDPITAKIISACIATLVTWLGNRYWTFRDRRRRERLRELVDFGLVALGGIGISVACLWVSHYLLGFTSLIADNIATNVIGFALSTAFRFFMYRHWVFARQRAAVEAK